MASISKVLCDKVKDEEDSIERDAVCHTAQTSSSDVEPQTSRTPTLSTSPSHHPSPPPSSVRTGSSQPPQQSRTFSHSLLSNSPDPSVISRKSKFADSGTTSAVGRASISMPPPIMKPCNHKPPISRQTTAILATSEALLPYSGLENAVEGKVVTEPVLTDDSDKTKSLGSSRGRITSESCVRSSPSDSTKTANPSIISTENDGHRLSFSSLYSLGSAVYNVAAGGSGAPSAPSSNAGSVALDQPTIATLPASSHLGSSKLELSSATTATDPISVIANSRSLHAGLRITRYFVNESFVADSLA